MFAIKHFNYKGMKTKGLVAFFQSTSIQCALVPVLLCFMLVFTQYAHASHSFEESDFGVQVENHHCKILHQALDTPKNNSLIQTSFSTLSSAPATSFISVLLDESEFIIPLLRAPPIL